ncbi:MAG: type II toxin-antitoxin system Phd/YefM family antitoxin [Propionibacteriaceae bacterium]|jgi:prevent-host-death family protein|nr:type II toxin-antitoxin system Phd/YefM family antitoxin [Propionibacteriaceae bacterium]
MVVTATEFKNNTGRYLKLAADEDVYVTRRGRQVAKLSAVTSDKAAVVEGLIGSIPGSGDVAEAREGRRARHEGAA